MNKTIIYALIYISGVLISAFAQVLLKKSADIKKDNIIKEYLNFKTICSYSIFFVATLCSVFAYKYLPLSYGPVLGTLEYIFVATLSYIFLKEKINILSYIIMKGVILLIITLFVIERKMIKC